jgi:hypothetical protein
MIDIATEILQSLQARNGKRIGMEEISVIHPLPWDIRTNAAGYSVIVDATGTEVLRYIRHYRGSRSNPPQ